MAEQNTFVGSMLALRLATSFEVRCSALHVSNRAVVNSIEFVLPALHSVAPECPGGTDEHKQEYNDDRGDSDNQDQKVHGSSGCELENHHGAHLLSWLKGMAARRTT